MLETTPLDNGECIPVLYPPTPEEIAAVVTAPEDQARVVRPVTEPLPTPPTPMEAAGLDLSAYR